MTASPLGRIAWAGAASLALTLVHPIAAPIVLVVLGIYVLTLTVQNKRIPWREVAGVAASWSSLSPNHDLHPCRPFHQSGHVRLERRRTKRRPLRPGTMP